MGGKILGDEGVHEGNDGIITEDDSVVCQEHREEEGTGKEGAGTAREKESAEDIDDFKNLACVLWRTINQYFPDFNEWLTEIKDSRDAERITYEAKTILWVLLLVFITKQGARKKIRDRMRTPEFLKTLKEYCGQEDIEQVPHDDTVVYFCVRVITIEQVEGILVTMMQRLFRQKVFDRFKLLDKWFTVALDGVHTHSYNYQHCDKCLCKEGKNGKKTWYHAKVQASLVLPNGMCLPMESEWIENTDGTTKQDCERKAAYRLIPKLRTLYPKLPICILGDALYCCEPMFQAIEKARMAWIIVFKEGTMSEIYTWAMDQKDRYGVTGEHRIEEEKKIAVHVPRTHQERLERKEAQHETRTIAMEGEYWWKTHIEHWENKRIYHVVAGKVTHDNKVACDYKWQVSDEIAALINKNTIEEIVDYGGRIRWKIENEGNNTQKNGGYNLKHCYVKDEHAQKIFHIFLDIAHVINQLIEKGSLIIKGAYGCIRDIAMYMFEHMRYKEFKKPRNPKRIQIRLYAGSYDTG